MAVDPRIAAACDGRAGPHGRGGRARRSGPPRGGGDAAARSSCASTVLPPTALHLMGLICSASGRHQRGGPATTARRCIWIQNHHDALIHLALLLEQQGDDARARVLLRSRAQQSSRAPAMQRSRHRLLEHDRRARRRVVHGTRAGDPLPQLPRLLQRRREPARRASRRPTTSRDWTEQARSRKRDVAERATVSVLIFRVGAEWLALQTTVAHRDRRPAPDSFAAAPAQRRRARPRNIRGELLVCVSLRGILGIDAPAPRPADRRDAQRGGCS